MERPGFDVIAEAESDQATTELTGCLPSECQSERVARIGVAGRDPVGDPPGQNPRLSRSGARDHRDQVSLGGDRGPLIGVEIREEYVGLHGSPSYGADREERSLSGGAHYRGGMPYPRKLLNDHETVAVDLHPHWWHFVEPVSALVGAIILGILTIAFTDSGSAWRTIFGWISVILIVGCIFWTLARFAQWRTTNIVVTNDRVIFREGVLAKSGIEIPLERVNNVHFSQGIIERMIGAGDLLIESGGELGQQKFTNVRRPDRVQNEIHAQMEGNERRRFQNMQSGGSDVATQLEKLEGMLERGTLSQEEFDSQKRKLLGE